MDYLSVLKKYELKATPQRLAVLQILGKRKHPSMEELYEKIKQNHPSVSLATVYKNVNTLKENGIIIEVNMHDGKSRFDLFLEEHLHVICKTCGNIKDVLYDKDCKLYQKHLEKNIKNSITSMDIVAHVEQCEKCL